MKETFWIKAHLGQKKVLKPRTLQQVNFDDRGILPIQHNLFLLQKKRPKRTIESILFLQGRYLKTYFNRVTNLLSIIFFMFLFNQIFLKLECD